ncbi:hypothetical protein ACFXB3_39395 [Streptomyces sp. NPDC059447]|uniref:hypothetical protein n=1 Tax=Streptomyces sp. NPDC059447 TaxID=3346834 RepID=UPI003673FDAB
MRSPRILATAALLAATAGCADAEGLQSSGDLGTAHAPQSLWKEYRPDRPDPAQQPGTAAVVPGIPEVTGAAREKGMRGVDPLAVVRADMKASVTQDGGTGRLVDPRALQRLALCAQAVDDDCPLRPAVLHDLTGDGRDELITALDLDGRLSELRVYTLRDDGRIARILSRRAVLEGVEVAAEHLAVREPTSNPSYVAVSDYVWDPASGTMNLSQLTLDDCPGGNGARCAP